VYVDQLTPATPVLFFSVRTYGNSVGVRYNTVRTRVCVCVTVRACLQAYDVIVSPMTPSSACPASNPMSNASSPISSEYTLAWYVVGACVHKHDRLMLWCAHRAGSNRLSGYFCNGGPTEQWCVRACVSTV
jgi:hypothetical protein